MSCDNSKINLREATYEDIDLLFEWANDDLTRKNSFDEAKICFDEHADWFKRLLDDENRYQLILMDGEIPIGQIRLSVLDGVAEIGYSVSPIYRGLGYGKIILSLTIDYVKEKLPFVTRLIGQVKPSNVASYKAFIDNGFEEKYRQLEVNVLNWNKSTSYNATDEQLTGKTDCGGCSS